MPPYRDPKVNRKFDVKGLRRRLGLTQGELSRAIGSTERTVRRWEAEAIAPQRHFIRELRRLEKEKFGGTTPDRPALPVPRRTYAERPDPDRHIGVAPGSF